MLRNIIREDNTTIIANTRHTVFLPPRELHPIGSGKEEAWTDGRGVGRISRLPSSDDDRRRNLVPWNTANALVAYPPQASLRLSLQIAWHAAIDIRVAQRAGQMQVTVHTADPALQANLRQDLPQLVQSLDRAGFNAETFVQRPMAVAAGSGSSFDQGSGGSPSNSQAFARGPGSGTSRESGGAGHSSESPFSGQQPSGENARDRQSQRWLEQIEE